MSYNFVMFRQSILNSLSINTNDFNIGPTLICSTFRMFFMKIFFGWMTSFFRFLFGSISYEWPVWISFVFSKLRNLKEWIYLSFKNSKKRSFAVLISVVFLMCGAAGGYLWLENRPKPTVISTSTKTIYPTSLVENAVPDTFKIKFESSAAQLNLVGKEVNDYITVTPKLEGTWKWISDDALAFQIKGDWPIGKTYEVKLSKKMFPSHVSIDKYEFKIKTPSFKMRLYDTSYYQNPNEAKDKKVVAEIRFSHPVDTKSLEKSLKLTYFLYDKKFKEVQEKKPLKFTVTYDKFFGRAFVNSEQLFIPNYDSSVEVEVDGNVVAQGSSSEADGIKGSVRVPGMFTHFQIEGIENTQVRNESYEQEQVLIVQSTAEMSQKQLSQNLQVFLLPVDRPKLPGQKKISKNFYWNAKDVSKPVVELSKSLELEPIPTELANAKTISYKFKAQPGRFLYVRIKKGTLAFGGYKLAEDAEFVVKVKRFPRELMFMAEGSILSLSGEQKISVLARNLKHVKFTARRLLPGQISHFVQKNEGAFSSPSFYEYYFGLDDMTESHEQIKALPLVENGKTQYTHFDFNQLMQKSNAPNRGVFIVKVEGFEEKTKQTTDNIDSRFVMVTDIGIISKKSVNGTYHVYAMNIRTGEPIEGAKVDVVGRNGLSIVSNTTTSTGHVKIDDLSDFKNEKEPVVFVVSKGNDMSMLPIRSGLMSSVNYSRYDIGGVRTGSKAAELNGYIFTDRGIYRPGELAQMGFVVKQTNWNTDMSQYNFEVFVFDPKGNRIRNERIKLTPQGLAEYPLNTELTWNTGKYEVQLYWKVGKEKRLVGSQFFKVEEFVPDRMKITARFSVPPNKGWLNPNQLHGFVNLQNLFGTAAQNRRVHADISLSPTYPSFYKFREWKFHDPMRSKKSFSEPLGELYTDKDGNVDVNLQLEKYESASYLVNFTAEGFELEGGRSVIASTSTLVSPLSYLIGYKEEGNLTYIGKGTKIGVKLIAVNSDLELIQVPELTLVRYEYRQVSTLVKQSNGTYKYESVRKEYEMDRKPFKLEKMENYLELDTAKPGDFAMVIEDRAGVELNKIPFSVAGTGNLSFNLEKNAELQIKLDKTDYDVGETMNISIRAPYVGSGLITIEKNDVYLHKWFTTTSMSSVQSIRIPDGLEGNAYVNVSFVRSLDSKEIFMSPLSTGVAAFSLNKEAKVNKISLKLPELVRPGENLEIRVSSKKPGKMIVFAVDEGILKVAKYENPDPLAHFYKKRALEVETQQILDLLLPEFSKLEINKSSEAGGSAALISKNLNPFKRKGLAPVAYWSGVIDVGSGGKTLNYAVPDYFNGQLRVIAVSVAVDSMDAASEKTFVRGHFVLSPNLPTFVAPGDKLKVTVGVSNNLEKSGPDAEVQVSLKASDNIQILGESVQKVKIAEGTEKSVTFEVLARLPLGNADFSFFANQGNKKAKLLLSTSVRPAFAYVTKLEMGAVTPASNKEIQLTGKMYEEFRKLDVSSSTLALSSTKGLINYLEKYPYGCTEQLVSKGFPMVVLSEYNLPGITRKIAAQQVAGISELLASRQKSDGSFVKWQGGAIENNFHTAYAFHYMVEAKSRNFQVPYDLMIVTLQYLTDFVEREPENISMARVQAYAAYLLSREGVLVTNALDGLEQWLKKLKDQSWKEDLIPLFMASAYKIMKSDKKAQEFLDIYEKPGKILSDYWYGVYDTSLHGLMRIYLMSLHFPEQLDKLHQQTFVDMANELQNFYNTTSSAMAVLAFEAFYRAKGKEAENLYKASQWIKGQSSPLKLTGSIVQNGSFSAEADKLIFSNSSKLPLFYSVTQAGFSSEPSLKTEANGIEVNREFITSSGQPVDKGVAIGEEVTVRLRYRTTMGSSRIYNVVVVDLLPGGFEPVLDSVKRDYNYDSGVEYVDAREDRLVLYTSVAKDMGTYEYKVKATNKGTYQVPPIWAEHMYDRGVYSIGKSTSIEVK